MKLYSAKRAPNPRRVEIFIAEKGIPDIERIEVDLNAGAHKTEDFQKLNPLSRIPVLVLDDGRSVAESRAICTYLESRFPTPNLMGEGGEERAMIEMIDRQIEFNFFLPIMFGIRHTHPGLAALENPQFPEYGKVQLLRMQEAAQWINARLEKHPFIAGDRFTIADITLLCGLDFAKLTKFKAGDAGFTHLQRWHENVLTRKSLA